MSLKRIAVIASALLLLASAAFVAATVWVGSWLMAPARTAAMSLPAELPGRDVSFEGASGDLLRGWFIEAPESCGTVVLMHAVRGDKLAMLPRARLLSDAGYAVLLFDSRAHGESGGDQITYGYLERQDAAAALHLVSNLRPGEPVAVIGFSLGGVAAVLNGPASGVEAYVLEAVHTTYRKALINRVRMHLGDFGPLTEFLADALLMHMEFRLGISTDDLRPIDHVASLGAPVLVVAGGEDRHTTIDDSRELFDRASEPKDFWRVEGAGHIDFFRHNPEGYTQTVLGFLRESMPCG